MYVHPMNIDHGLYVPYLPRERILRPCQTQLGSVLCPADSKQRQPLAGTGAFQILANTCHRHPRAFMQNRYNHAPDRIAIQAIVLAMMQYMPGVDCWELITVIDDELAQCVLQLFIDVVAVIIVVT